MYYLLNFLFQSRVDAMICDLTLALSGLKGERA